MRRQQLIALAKSLENLIPPSEITGIFTLSQYSTTSIRADNCGTPTPATILVVQIEPGPMPTFTALTQHQLMLFAASAVAIFPAIKSLFWEGFS